MNDQLNTALDEAQEITVEREVPCRFLSGRAGTGKTFEIRRRCDEREDYGVLCSTTGISAVNLSAITINSLLGYFDTRSLRDAFLSGHITRKLHDLALEYEWLCVDEVSMMDGDQLDILYRAVQEANRYRDVKRLLGILLVGDFAQLPPVKAKWAFEANVWPKFADNTITLAHVWRQDQGRFLDALNAVRAGRGAEGADILDSLGVRWHDQTDTEFDGTTILAKNDQVGRFNGIALDRVQGQKFTVTSRRWGKQRSEWGENSRTHEWGIPPTMELKLGAYVMLLANGNQTVSIDILHCPSCGARFDGHEKDMRVLQRDIHSSVHQQLEAEDKKPSQDLFHQLPFSMDKAGVPELEEGDAGKKQEAGTQANRKDPHVPRRICESISSGPPQCYSSGTCIPTSSEDGGKVGEILGEERSNSSSQWKQAGQSDKESTTSNLVGPLRDDRVSLLPREIRNQVTCFKCHKIVNPIKRSTNSIEFANGDCGWIEEYNPVQKLFYIRLVRTERIVKIGRLVRDVSSKEKPDGWYGETIPADLDVGAYIPRPHYRGRKKLYVSGQVEYYPMRLAYASTCHKSQGLSLDRAQVDFRNPFFGANSMLYVSLSRVRTFEGLRIVGSKETFVSRCNVDLKVTRWL